MWDGDHWVAAPLVRAESPVFIGPEDPLAFCVDVEVIRGLKKTEECVPNRKDQ